MSKDRWDKFQVIVAAFGGVLIPLAIFLAGVFISDAERDNATASLQAERLTDLIEHLSSNNPKQQLIAAEVAGYLAKAGQLPSELVPTLTRIAKQSDSSETALAATQAVVVAAEKNMETKIVVEQAFTSLPPRVYFHISNEEQRTLASSIAKKLEKELDNLDVTVPGIELKPGPHNTELRFFKSAESEEAKNIYNALTALGISVKLIDLSSRYESSKGIRPRHYELWFGKDA